MSRAVEGGGQTLGPAPRGSVVVLHSCHRARKSPLANPATVFRMGIPAHRAGGWENGGDGADVGRGRSYSAGIPGLARGENRNPRLASTMPLQPGIPHHGWIARLRRAPSGPGSAPRSRNDGGG
ncbi:hypothetical protein JCM2811A_50300 [Methylorubrum rhodinum]